MEDRNSGPEEVKFTLNVPIVMPVDCRLSLESPKLIIFGYEATLYETLAGHKVNKSSEGVLINGRRWVFLQIHGVPQSQLDGVLLRVQQSVMSLSFKFNQGFAVTPGPILFPGKASDGNVHYDFLSVAAFPLGVEGREHFASMTSEVQWPGIGLLSQLNFIPVPTDESHLLALELFRDSHYEQPRSQFILLVSILEILSHPPDRPKHIINWMQPIIRTVEQIGAKDIEFKDLWGSLRHVGTKSFRSSIADLTQRTMLELGVSKEESAKWAKLARNVYDLRSLMVHKGQRPDIAKGILVACTHLVRIILGHQTGIAPNGKAPSLECPKLD